MESDLKEIKPKVEEIYSLKPKIEESHQWLSALRYSSEFHKAEVDRMDNKVALIEGVLQGFDKSLEILKKAQ